jgi:hypothetical protein
MTQVDSPRQVHRYDIFISHSKLDKPVADAVVHSLEANGMRCWIAPRDISPGKSWSEAIIDGLDQSTVFVLIYSSNANESQHVLREVERAISKNKIVIPFRLEDVPPSRGLEYCISLPHWIDALTPPLQEHIDRLVKTVAANVEVQSKHDSPIANVTENTTSHSTALSRNDKHKTRREYFSRACELVLTFALLAIGLILLRQGAILRNQYFIAGFLMLLSTICYVFARIAFLLTSWLGCDGKEKFWACSISALTAIFLLQFGTNLIGPDPYGVPVWIAQKLWGTDIFSSTESDGIWRSNTDPWIEYSFISDSGILHSPEILGWRQTPLSNITSVQILVRQSQEVIYGTCFGTRHEYRVVFCWSRTSRQLEFVLHGQRTRNGPCRPLSRKIQTRRSKSWSIKYIQPFCVLRIFGFCIAFFISCCQDMGDGKNEKSQYDYLENSLRGHCDFHVRLLCVCYS